MTAQHFFLLQLADQSRADHLTIQQQQQFNSTLSRPHQQIYRCQNICNHYPTLLTQTTNNFTRERERDRVKKLRLFSPLFSKCGKKYQRKEGRQLELISSPLFSQVCSFVVVVVYSDIC